MKRDRKCRLECLENRQLMAGDFATGAFAGVTNAVLDRGTPVIPAVPAYSSNPGAAATLYLDFNGHFEAQWGDYPNATTPVFSMDADTTSFAPNELAAIKEVWQRVAEDFAPFNINVTTVDPGNFANGRALRVAIGGSGLDWYHQPVGGVSYLNSFTNSLPNTVYVFNSQSSNVSARIIADIASQEVGHAFGLYHQSVVDANGNLLSEYARGTNEKSPLMGLNYDSQRTTWWKGTSSYHIGNVYAMQDDMAVIASAKNTFGYRPDDFGNTWQTALPMGQLSSYGPISNQFGIIGNTADTDWFQFNVTTNGRMSLQANVAQVGANLDAKLSLFRLEHHLVNGKGSFSQPLTLDPNVINGLSLSAIASAAPTTPTTVQPTPVSSSRVRNSGQLLAITATPVAQPPLKQAMTSASLRAAAVDEAMATGVPGKTLRLSDEIFDLLGAA